MSLRLFIYIVDMNSRRVLVDKSTREPPEFFLSGNGSLTESLKESFLAAGLMNPSYVIKDFADNKLVFMTMVKVCYPNPNVYEWVDADKITICGKRPVNFC